MAYRELTWTSDEWTLPGAVISTEGEVELTVEFETEGGEPVVFEYRDARVNGERVDTWLQFVLMRWIAENQAKLTQRFYDQTRFGEAAE